MCICVYIHVYMCLHIFCDSATGEPQAVTATPPSATAAAAHSNQCPPSMCLCYVVHWCIVMCTLFHNVLSCDLYTCTCVLWCDSATGTPQPVTSATPSPATATAHITLGTSVHVYT